MCLLANDTKNAPHHCRIADSHYYLMRGALYDGRAMVNGLHARGVSTRNYLPHAIGEYVIFASLCRFDFATFRVISHKHKDVALTRKFREFLSGKIEY